MTLKMSRLSRGAATMLLATVTAGVGVVAVPAAAAVEAPATPAPTCKESGKISVLSAFDQMVAETKAGIPAQFGSMFDTNAANFRNALISTKVAYVDVSRDSSEINPVAEENDDHYANFAVTRLDKIRHGEDDAIVAVQDLTLSEVVETLVLGMYTFTVPLDVVAQAMPPIAPIPVIGTLAGGTPLIGSYLTVGFLAKLPFQLGSQGIKALARGLQKNLTERCWDGEEAPTDEERLTDGGARPVVPVQEVERANASYMALEDDATCVPASAETLGAALDRVAADMRPQIPADKLGAFDAEIARLSANARSARITNNFIMKDPADLNPILAILDNPLITFTWGAVQGALDGTGNQSTAIADLTMGNGVDYAYVADSLVVMIISNLWGVTAGNIGVPYLVGNLLAPAGLPQAKLYGVVPNVANVASYFSGAALEVYDHVLDTMCLAKDTATPAVTSTATPAVTSGSATPAPTAEPSAAETSVLAAATAPAEPAK